MAVFQIYEYWTIRAKGDNQHFERPNEIIVPKRTFDNLWDFILETHANYEESQRAFELYTRRGVRVIKSKNYVGIIETKNGDTIEILPKIYGISILNSANASESKRIFLKMLRVLLNIPPFSFQEAKLASLSDFPILELFISNYIREAELILASGLKRAYSKIEGNERFLKGRLVFKDHLKRNLTNGARFYVCYSSYSVDIPINRIIKSTCLKLLNLSKSSNNRGQIQRLLIQMESVPHSKNINGDLSSSSFGNRLFNNYKKILEWSEMFLLNKGFTNFSGATINQALLFPMERVFEKFVAFQIRRHSINHKISTQHHKYHLVEKYDDKPKFRLKPDVVATNEESCIIIDTKWKIIDENSKTSSIKQSDLYQLYAYGRKYLKGHNEPVLFLIYPYNRKFTTQLPTFYYEKEGDFWLRLYALPFDLTGNYTRQVKALFNLPIKSVSPENKEQLLMAAESNLEYAVNSTRSNI
jgi:5-methylcytosine-specific restriction enzyme subunit McrC